MSTISSLFSLDRFRQEAASLLASVESCASLDEARATLFRGVSEHQFDTFANEKALAPDEIIRCRDCARALRSLFKERSDSLAGMSVAEALWDIARSVPRSDLQPGFYAELIHLVCGLEGRAPLPPAEDARLPAGVDGREAAALRSAALDMLWERVEGAMARYSDGLAPESVERRARRRALILSELGGDDSDWTDWRWQVANIVRDLPTLERLVHLEPQERAAVQGAHEARLPFGITPYYLSLMDDAPSRGRDIAIRAQVLPPAGYVKEMAAHKGERERAFDFMLERDTSPTNLVTRRYPAIAILKPFLTCPQICVYCQRNWEIEDAMASQALASDEDIEAACDWIGRHPALREILITGGDALSISNERLAKIVGRLAAIDHIDMIRIGTRTLVTLPMRITDELVHMLASFRDPGKRELCVITHVEHAYEVTPELVAAVERLRRAGISIHNQHVYTFFVSRRFENARLRMLLRRSGILPYYTFVPKGKEETAAYRVPLARLLQEQQEEARLLPGLRRSDESVYNVPGLGKNYVRAAQHRDLLSIRPDGSRVYEFHPWEKGVVTQNSYVGSDVPILTYLERLSELGECTSDYASIWYYY